MIGKQSGKGTTATPNITIAFLDDGFNTGQQINSLKSGGDNEYHLDTVKMEHRENFSFTVNARPDIVTYLSGYILGTAAISGAGDPYTHTITRGERPWLTVERKLNSTVTQRLTDAKIENYTLSGESGQPVKLTIDGNALTAQIRTTALTPACDTESPLMFYDGSGRFKIDTTIDENIKSFEIKVNVNSGGGLRDDQFLIVDLPDFNYSVECSAELNTTNFDRWQKITYNASTTPQETVSTGALEIDLQNVATTTRQIKLTIPEIYYKSIGNVTLSPEGTTMTESIAGVGLKQSTTELMTIVCRNSISTTII